MNKQFRHSRYAHIIGRFILPTFLLSVIGCSSPSVSSLEEVSAFERAGPAPAEEPSSHSTTYRVVTGDVLELYMPIILKDVIDSYQKQNEPYLCRVNNSGNIPLPIIGEINVANNTLTELESAVSNAYYPQYFKEPPSIVCKVNEHIDERSFTVTGLVNNPGVFDYPTNVRYSLVDAIAFAEGVNMIADPRFAKVFRRGEDGKVIAATFKIDQKYYDEASTIVIKPGDVISVQITPRTQMNMFLSQVLHLNFGAYVRPEDL
jgi:protein involved in polysaccharide export with SLBB domain